MTAKVSARVQQLVEEAAALPAADLAALLDALQRLPKRRPTPQERDAVIAERVARVHAGDIATLSVDEVEQSLRRELDF